MNDISTEGQRSRECRTLFTDPSRREEANRARARGGRGRRTGIRRPSHLDNETDIDNALNWVWSGVSQKKINKDTATQLLKIIDLRSERLASATLADLAAKVTELEKSRD